MNDYIPPPLLGAFANQYRMRLVVGEHSARHVRRIVRSLLREWEMADLADAVELAVTELVANVVRHMCPTGTARCWSCGRPRESGWR